TQLSRLSLHDALPILSEQDMQALSDAQGTEAARLFLNQMIAHHEGAIDMAQTEIEDGQFPDAVQMARTIVDTQQQEIDTMRQLRSEEHTSELQSRENL